MTRKSFDFMELMLTVVTIQRTTRYLRLKLRQQVLCHIWIRMEIEENKLLKTFLQQITDLVQALTFLYPLVAMVFIITDIQNMEITRTALNLQ